jgi:hypothetical protein
MPPIKSLADVRRHIAAYRIAVATRDSADNPAVKVEIQRVIDQMCREWKIWNGGSDTLHKMAFGGDGCGQSPPSPPLGIPNA